MASFCIPQRIAPTIRQAIESGRVSADELAQKSTADRKQIFKELFEEGNRAQKQKISQKEIDELVTKLNRGFEERIVTSSRNIDEMIAKQRATLADTNKSKAAKSRARGILKDLEGGQEKLLERQRKLLNDYLEREANRIPKRARKETFEKVNELNHLISPSERKLFLEDLVEQKFGFGLSREDKETLFKLSQESVRAQENLRIRYDDITSRAKEAFKRRDDAVLKQREIDKVSDPVTKKQLQEQLDIEAQHFADQVYDGVVDINGNVLSKTEARKQQIPRIQEAVKTQRLIDFVSDQERAVKTIRMEDVKAAKGIAEKWPLMSRLIFQNFFELTGSIKGIVASIDASVLLRQGWHVALTSPKVWYKDVGLTLKESYSFTFKGQREVIKLADDAGITDKIATKMPGMENPAHLELRAEIASRANAINGKYQAASNNFALDVMKEESFPTSLPTRIPVLGRAFAGSEYLFNAQSLRWRSDMADRFIREAELKGFNLLTDKQTADSLGELVGAMTGRGLPFGARSLEKNPELTKTMNYLFFSPRFVGSRFFTFKAPIELAFDPGNYAKQQAARYAVQSFFTSLGLVIGSGFVAKSIWGDEAGFDLDARSNKFGHLILGDNAFDFTGGHQTVVSLMTKLGMATQGVRWDSNLQIYRPLPFSQSSMDILANFFFNKASPQTRVFMDLINGHRFGGEELSTEKFLIDILTPLSIRITAEEWANNGWGDAMLVLAGETFGVSSKNMGIRPMSTEWNELKERSPKKYNQAVKILNQELFEEVERLRNDRKFQELPREEQDKEIASLARRIKSNTVDEYLEDVPKAEEE